MVGGGGTGDGVNLQVDWQRFVLNIELHNQVEY